MPGLQAVVEAERRKEPATSAVRGREARELAGTHGDAVVAAQRLPGVAREPVGSGQLVVWGAAPRDTRLLLDGIELPALYHGGGLRSVVPTELVKRIELAPAAFGPQYGRALGGVLAIDAEAPDEGATRLRASLDPLDAHASVATPLSGGHLFAGARYSLLDRLLGPVLSTTARELFPLPRYWDGQLLAAFPLRAGERLELLLLGASDSALRTVDADDCARAIEANRDILVGVKIRLSDSCADDGRNEAEAYERALRAAAMTGLPLMVHHSFSTVDLSDCPGRMKPGDIYTHCFHGFPSTILEPESRRIHPAVAAARERGVLFDIGHGQGSFTWTVAEAAARQGFWPDTISTDLHSGTCEGPCYDMPTAMTRMLRVGMPLEAVIRAATIGPVEAVGIAGEAGTLGLGREADVAVLRIEDAGFELDDCQGQMRLIEKRIRAEAVWRAGERCAITEPLRFADPAVTRSQREWWPRLVVRDALLAE